MRKWRRHRWGSRGGLTLLAAGFGLQMVVMFLPTGPATLTRHTGPSSLLSNATLAAWFQAFGTIGAIAVAFWVGHQQAKVVLGSAREQQLEKRRSIVAVAEAAAEHARNIGEVLGEIDPGHTKMYGVYAKSIFDGMIRALSSAPIHELGTAEGVIALLAIRDQFVFLDVAMERHLGGPYKIPEFVREVESCGADASSQQDVIEGQKTMLSDNVRTHLRNIRDLYSTLQASVVGVDGKAKEIAPESARVVVTSPSGRSLIRRMVGKAASYLNILGLVLSITGVCMVWWWGLPQPSFSPAGEITASGRTMEPNHLTVSQNNAQKRVLMSHYRHMSEMGMALIVIGFAGQLAAEIVERRRRELQPRSRV